MDGFLILFLMCANVLKGQKNLRYLNIKLILFDSAQFSWALLPCMSLIDHCFPAIINGNLSFSHIYLRLLVVLGKLAIGQRGGQSQKS